MLEEYKFYTLLRLLVKPYNNLYFLLVDELHTLFSRSSYFDKDFWEIVNIRKNFGFDRNLLALPAA